MTREEAIKSALKYLVHKQQEQGSWGYADNDNINKVPWDEALEWIDQQPCGDLISRQAVLDLAESGKLVSNGNYKSVCDAINGLPPVEPETREDIGEISDGYHTFNQLYHQRAILFAAIVNQNKGISWKSYKHSDGKYCFDSDGEWFVVGIDTPKGSYTYHYSKEYWDYFDCIELERGKEWDGHTEDDVIRLLSLASVEPERKPGKWVPIRTKSPQNGQRIFISTIKGTIHDVVWNTDCIHNYARNGCWYRNWFVVAWMPFFIKSYKAESDDRNEI